MSRFSKKMAEKGIVCSFSPWKWLIRYFLCFFWKNVLEIKFHYLSEFGVKIKHRVEFWKKKKNKASGIDFKISQRVIFCIEKKVNTSDFELKFFRHVWFQKHLQTKNHVLFFFSVKTNCFAFFVHFLRRMVLI